jgi:hypothetical protein
MTSVRAADADAFINAADDLLGAQQALIHHPLPEELRALTLAYLRARVILLDGVGRARDGRDGRAA